MTKVHPQVEALEPRVVLNVPTPAHVVIVMEENHSYNEIIGSPNAPYINSLASQGALMTNSFALQHPSQPNYLDLFSGSNQGVNDDSCPHSFSAANLASELIAAGLTFGSFAESLPSVGYTGCTAPGGYVRRHNPAVDFTNVPSADVLPFSSFPTNYATLPTVSFVVPDLADDMHNGTIQTADTWLKNNLDGYAPWALKNNSLLIVTWDEDDGTQNNQIPTLFVGQAVQPGQYNESINHFNVLATVEAIYGLPFAGASATANPITDIWAKGTLTASGQAVTAMVGQNFNGTVALVSDTYPDLLAGDLTATINWGDGSNPDQVTLTGPDAKGFYEVAGTHTYTHVGRDTITVSVQDHVNGGTTSAQGTVTVINTLFVNFGGALWEHASTDPHAGWYEVWGSGVTQFSASQVQADTVFVNFGGALWEHSGRDMSTGWSEVWGSGVTDVSAGVDASGQPVAFVNFGGALWEHSGTDMHAGWSEVWGSGVTQASASQVQADTVFANFGGSLWEHSGTDMHAGWSDLWNGGITDVSVGIDASGQPTVFANFGGSLWEHSGTDMHAGWSEVWSSGVTQASASQILAHTVFVNFGGSLWEHTGTDMSSGWSEMWASGVTGVSAGV
jgi:acid phosphatase